LGKTASEEVVLTVLSQLNNGKVEEAVAGFAEEFRFKDHGLGLEFTDKKRLAEFFEKTREFFPDTRLQTDVILVIGERVITEWTLNATLPEPFYGGLKRKVKIYCTGRPLFGPRTARSPTGRTTTTD